MDSSVRIVPAGTAAGVSEPASDSLNKKPTKKTLTAIISPARITLFFLECPFIIIGYFGVGVATLNGAISTTRLSVGL